jgi:hypothetical protein
VHCYGATIARSLARSLARSWGHAWLIRALPDFAKHMPNTKTRLTRLSLLHSHDAHTLTRSRPTRSRFVLCLFSLRLPRRCLCVWYVFSNEVTFHVHSNLRPALSVLWLPRSNTSTSAYHHNHNTQIPIPFTSGVRDAGNFFIFFSKIYFTKVF